MYIWENQYNKSTLCLGKCQNIREKGKIVPKMLIFLFEGEGEKEGTIAQKLCCPPKKKIFPRFLEIEFASF